MGGTIFMLSVITVFLLIWTKINYSAAKEVSRERIDIWKREDEFRKIESVEVIFRDGGTSEFKGAKSYGFDYDVYSIYDKDGKAIALLERREVSAVLIRRKGEDAE